jgi:hypothetical protein
MRTLLTGKIEPNDTQLLHLTLGRLSAQRIADPFFAMCRGATSLNENELAIAKGLRREVILAIERRNRMAHGDWFVTRGAEIGEESRAPVLRTFSTSQLHDPFILEELTVSQIDEICHGLEELASAVGEFGEICTRQGQHANRDSPTRVEDFFEINDGRVAYTLGIS